MSVRTEHLTRPEELPFDITADEIEISDADYAIWYMDCQDNPKKYEGKKVSFLALVYNPDKLKKRNYGSGTFCNDLLCGGCYLHRFQNEIRQGRMKFRTNPGSISQQKYT